jgi:hypothetical protein
MVKLFSTYLFCLLLYYKLESATIFADTTISDTTTHSSDPTTSSVISESTSTNNLSSTDYSTSISTETSTDSSTSPATDTSTYDSTSTDTETSTDSSTSSATDASTDTSTITSTGTSDTTTVTSTESSTGDSSTTELTTTPSSTTIHQITQKSFKWTSSNMKENPIVFTVSEDYSYVSVTVSGVDMDDGNYLLIEGGDHHKEDSTDGRVFANQVKGPLSYLSKTTSVYAFCNMVDNDETTKHNFTVQFEETGEKTTTTSTLSTTTVSLPPTEQGDSTYITVNISGRALAEYNNETIYAFQQCVVTMGTNYCKEQNIHLQQEITTTYVWIDYIKNCPYTWSRSETCVQIKFKLPIFHDGEGYLLTTEHLEIMWLRWDELDSQCLSNNNFFVYTEPDVENSVMWWAIGISLVVVFFVILLWFLKTFSSKLKTAIIKRRRKNSDTMSMISSKKDSLISLTPHYLQEHQDIPKFFDS